MTGMEVVTMPPLLLEKIYEDGLDVLLGIDLRTSSFSRKPGADKIANTLGRPVAFIPGSQNSSPFIAPAPFAGLQAPESSRPMSALQQYMPVADTSTSSAPGVSMPIFSGINPAKDSSRMSPALFTGSPNVPSSTYIKQDASAYQPIQTPSCTTRWGSSPNQMSSVGLRHPSATYPNAAGGNFPLHAISSSLHAPVPNALPPSPGQYNLLPRGSMPLPPVDMSFTNPRLASFSGLPAPPPPPVGAPVGFASREKLQYPSAAPPLGQSFQGLVEDFQSISLGSTPGSDPGLDLRSLPRPLDKINEPISILEKYPFNCHPRFLRLTTHAIPSSQSLLARWHLPLGIVGSSYGRSSRRGIIRCRRCRTYINPYVTFTDAGRKWRCNICSLINDVPTEYFCALDANGRRHDLELRPELSKRQCRICCPKGNIWILPMASSMVFRYGEFYDFVSFGNCSSSSLHFCNPQVVTKAIKSCLDSLPGFPRTQIGFLTFDSTLHFYGLKACFSSES
ncbi:hypothetical protein HPP92_018183 [Vanilla planifolia]|uniref:Uncharacterized protein n=1 Tax=Vanilla planifolia TaxID=51239 RepID=A0A835Q8B0_VANPL|nr:hypothetical protein HPP92_018183 [Vanilla planifolia]